MPPEDDFRRDSDTRTRRNAIAAAVVVAAGLVALLAGVLLARSSPTSSSAPRATASTRPVATAPASVTTAAVAPTPIPAVPVLGSGFSAAYDDRTHQLVTFGGVDSYDTTWVWDGRRWTLARPAVSPAGRFNAAAAYDPVSGVVLLYGGRLAPGDLVQDTWAWDGATWSRVDAGSSALPAYARMAWDGTRNQMLLVNNMTDINSGTWVWSGSSWVRRPRGDLPAGTFLLGMDVDPVTHALLGVSCCSQGQGEIATLSWDGAAWHHVTTTTVPGFTVSMVRDPVSSRILLFADPSIAAEVWSWTGSDWSLLPNERVPVFPTKAVVDSDTHRVLIVGSAAEPVQGRPQPVQLWTLLGSSWAQLR
jgi:hypothetical protein